MLQRLLPIAIVLALFATTATSVRAEPGQAARHRSFMQTATAFLQNTAPGARALFAERNSKASLIALGAVLERTNVSRDLLKKTLNNPHTFAKKDGLTPMILPAIKALARLGDIPGSLEVLQRSAKSHKDEGGTRGALFELVAGSAVKRMGYKLDGLSFQIGDLETDGVINKGSTRPTFVNMKSISRQNVLERVTDKAVDQLQKRNGTKAGRLPAERNPALLVIGKMPGVTLSSFDWAGVATRTGSDLTVISVNPTTARGKVLFRKGVDQRAEAKTSRPQPTVRTPLLRATASKRLTTHRRR